MMKQMKKGTLIVIICVAVLAAAVAVFAILNADDLDIKKELEMNAEFVIKYGDDEERVTMQDVIDLVPVSFNVTMDTSDSAPTVVEFTGVELSKICESVGLNISAAEVFEVRALDGYSSALFLDEVLAEGNVYICLYKNGEAMKTKSEGGSGPYMMVIKSADYSQRWCKFVQEVVIR